MVRLAPIAFEAYWGNGSRIHSLTTGDTYEDVQAGLRLGLGLVPDSRRWINVFLLGTDGCCRLGAGRGPLVFGSRASESDQLGGLALVLGRGCPVLLAIREGFGPAGVADFVGDGNQVGRRGRGHTAHVGVLLAHRRCRSAREKR